MIFEDYPRLSVALGTLGTAAIAAAPAVLPYGVGWFFLPAIPLTGGAAIIGLCELCVTCRHTGGERDGCAPARPTRAPAPDRSTDPFFEAARWDAVQRPSDDDPCHADRIADERRRSFEFEGCER